MGSGCEFWAEGKFCDKIATAQSTAKSTAHRRQIHGKIHGSSTAYRHPLKFIFQMKMDLGVRLGVLLGFARWRRRLVPSLDFDHFCFVSWFWQFGRAPELGKSQKSQNQKILYAPVRGKKTAGLFCPPKKIFCKSCVGAKLARVSERWVCLVATHGGHLITPVGHLITHGGHLITHGGHLVGT